MARQGITPVVAIVLLLMMTVAAAGGAYTWVTGIIQQGQEEGTAEFNRDLQVRDISCTASSNKADFYLTNTGEIEIDGNDVTVYLYNVSTGNLVTTNSTDDPGFAAPGAIAVGEAWDSTVTFDGSGMGTRQYRVEFEFTNEDSYSISGTCQAQ